MGQSLRKIWVETSLAVTHQISEATCFKFNNIKNILNDRMLPTGSKQSSLRMKSYPCAVLKEPFCEAGKVKIEDRDAIYILRFPSMPNTLEALLFPKVSFEE